MNNEIMVSVLVASYKHSKYIRKCIDSILEQEVDFKYEIIVGDDCSNDGTEEILRDYEKRYPDVFTIIINPVNLGPTKNSINIKKQCRGKYIAGVESDDFWTDAHRLQKQVDFLESHSEYSAVGCNYVNVDPDGKNPYISMLKWQVDKSYNLKDFMRYGFVIHGNTILSRNVLPKDEGKYLDLRMSAPTMGDVITRTMLYTYGNIYVLPDIMHAHRCGSNDKSSFYFSQKKDAIKYSYMFSNIVDALERYFDHKYNFQIMKANRVGNVLINVLVGNYQIEKNEFKDFMKTLSPLIRIVSYERMIQLGVRAMAHKVGRNTGCVKGGMSLDE